MYQNLMYAVKRRIIDECEMAFQNHPAYAEKVKVYHKYPYEERIQYGILLRNTSASQIRMSADNFLTDLISHVRLARWGNYPGLSVEWVRENDYGITTYIKEEDVSFQLDPTQRMFMTQYPIVSGQSNTKYADNIGQVDITINGTMIYPEYVNGEKRVIMLSRAPDAGAVVKISYYKKSVADPGAYVLDFIEDNQFTVSPVFFVEEEEVFTKTTGTEITAQLDNVGAGIQANSCMLYLTYTGSDAPIVLVSGTDYTLNLSTGVVTFITTVLKGFKMLADYRYQPLNYNNGPYTIQAYQENHTAIPGVVLCIGSRAKKGDRQAVIVSKFRESQARIYGGHWEMSLEVSVISKDPIQMEEMADQLINHLWGIRKGTLELEGITLNSVEPSGESEEAFIDTTGDVYYTTSIAINLMSEWQEFVPYLFKIRLIYPTPTFMPETKDYLVDQNSQILDVVQGDSRKVIKFPTLGYEKLT